MTVTVIILNYIFHFLLWHFRIFGLMPGSKTRWIHGVSRFFSGFQLLVNISLIVIGFYVAEEHLDRYSRELYVYVGFGLYGLCVFTYIVNIIESLVYCKEQSYTFDSFYAMANESSKRFGEKLFKLKIKSLLVPLLIAMMAVWLVGIFKFFGLEAISFVYFNFFMLLRSIQFHMLADGIRVKLEIINEDLIDMLTVERVALDFKAMRAKMEKIRSDYVRLKDLSILVNDSNGWSMLCLAFLFACFLICITYWFVLSLFKDIAMLEAHESICYIAVLFLILAVTTDPCTQCLGLSSQIGYNLHKLQHLGEDPAVVTQIASQITDHPIVFTAAGYFQVNYGFLASILAATVTYLMILISFDKDQSRNIGRLSNATLIDGQ